MTFFKFTLFCILLVCFEPAKAQTPESVLLSYSDLSKLSSNKRDTYIRSISKLLVLFSPREQKTVFQILWPDVYAAEGFRCVGGGVPVPSGGQCGVQSYAGFSCQPGQQICNPFLFGVKPDGKPFCYRRATTELCYRNVVPGRNSVTDLVFTKPGNEQAYKKFVQEINAICHHVENRNTSPLVEIQERPATLRKACQFVRKQTQLNTRRKLVGYKEVLSDECTSSDCNKITASSKSAEAAAEPQIAKLGLITESCSMRLGGNEVNCNSTTQTQRTWDGVRKMVCLHESSNLNFCPSGKSDEDHIDAYLKRIDAAADVMGLDRRHLACMTLIESNFNKEKVSSAGAAGLTSFNQETAEKFASRIQNDYRREWDEFQRMNGTRFPHIYVTPGNIRSGHSSYGIFAMATYLKDTIHQFKGDLSTDWERYLLGGGDGMNLFHAQIASYNKTPYRVDDFTKHVTGGNTMRSYPELNRETLALMNKFNECMYSDSGWIFDGKRPSREKQEACGLTEGGGICPGEKVFDREVHFEDIPMDETSGVY